MKGVSGILFVLLFTTGCVHVGADNEKLISDFVTEASQQVNNAILATQQHMEHTFDQTPDTRLLFAQSRMPSQHGALHQTASAEIFERANNRLRQTVGAATTSQMQAIMTQAGCHSNPPISCKTSEFNQRYRTSDGTCNNLDNPYWGARMTAMVRLLPPRYEDGYNEPIGWNEGRLYNGYELPGVRKVTNEAMASSTVTNDNLYSDMFVQWGQFQDHGIDLTPTCPSSARFDNGVPCEMTCENSAPCFPIIFPEDDPRNSSAQCIPFTRSATECTLSSRNQLNAITAFIDGSMVYGSSDDEFERLRELNPNNGNLLTGVTSEYGKGYMPYAPKDGPLCAQSAMDDPVPCFSAGDKRANEQQHLTTLHTLWVREHNRIAAVLRDLNPGLDGDTIFHETRKIIGSMMQCITYNAYLPKVLGPSGMADIGPYNGYDSLLDPSVSNAFATAAFRFGHGTVQPTIKRVDETLNPIAEGHLLLHKSFFSPWRIIYEGGLDPLIRGMYAFPAKSVLNGQVVNHELTERLFALLSNVASDLASANTQRGRDHGLPSYNAYRELCGLPRAATFDDLAGEIPDQGTRDKLEALYGHPDNIDLFVGGMLEEKVSGARVGPVFSCILVKQYIRLRDGDRFWYEEPSTFSPEQVAEIHKISLARVICDSSDNIQEVPTDPFVNTALADFVSCNDIPSMDLSKWTGLQPILDDCPSCEFGADNVGFLSHLNCRRYYRCERLSSGGFRKHEMCCPDGVYWNQRLLTCSQSNPGTSTSCPQIYNCPPQNNIIDGECLLLPGPATNNYIEMVGTQQYTRPCPAGTVYKHELCTCDFPEAGEGPVESCDSDPLLWFKFNGDYNDCQCPKAAGIEYGDTRLALNDPSSADCDGTSNCAVCFYGDGGFIEFGYLKNWFAGKPHKEFSMTVWFYQTQDGYAETLQGIFTNGLCKDDPSLSLALGNQAAAGNVNDNIFGTEDSTASNRAYSAEQWIHVGITYNKTHTVYYMNAVLVDTREANNGPVQNTQVGATIGLVHKDCIPYFLTGCIDDFRLYDRYVSEEEIGSIFAGGRM